MFDPTRSHLLNLPSSLTAGSPASLSLLPRDGFGNDYASPGLTFRLQLAYPSSPLSPSLPSNTPSSSTAFVSSGPSLPLSVSLLALSAGSASLSVTLIPSLSDSDSLSLSQPLTPPLSSSPAAVHLWGSPLPIEVQAGDVSPAGSSLEGASNGSISGSPVSFLLSARDAFFNPVSAVPLTQAQADEAAAATRSPLLVVSVLLLPSALSAALSSSPPPPSPVAWTVSDSWLLNPLLPRGTWLLSFPAASHGSYRLSATVRLPGEGEGEGEAGGGDGGAGQAGNSSSNSSNSSNSTNSSSSGSGSGAGGLHIRRSPASVLVLPAASGAPADGGTSSNPLSTSSPSQPQGSSLSAAFDPSQRAVAIQIPPGLTAAAIARAMAGGPNAAARARQGAGAGAAGFVASNRQGVEKVQEAASPGSQHMGPRTRLPAAAPATESASVWTDGLASDSLSVQQALSLGHILSDASHRASVSAPSRPSSAPPSPSPSRSPSSSTLKLPGTSDCTSLFDPLTVSQLGSNPVCQQVSLTLLLVLLGFNSSLAPFTSLSSLQYASSSISFFSSPTSLFYPSPIIAIAPPGGPPATRSPADVTLAATASSPLSASLLGPSLIGACDPVAALDASLSLSLYGRPLSFKWHAFAAASSLSDLRVLLDDLPAAASSLSLPAGMLPTGDVVEVRRGGRLGGEQEREGAVGGPLGGSYQSRKTKLQTYSRYC